MIYAGSQEVVCTFCKGLGCCGTEPSLILQRGPVPLQTLPHPQPLLCSVPAFQKPSGFSSFSIGTSFASRIPPDPWAPPATVLLSLSHQHLHPLLLFFTLFNPASQSGLSSSLTSLHLAFSLTLPHPSQGFALRSLRLYSVSAILVFPVSLCTNFKKAQAGSSPLSSVC